MHTFTSAVLRKDPMKVNVKSIVTDIQALYAKDKKVQSIICTGDSVKTAYTAKDLISLPEGHPLRELLGLPGIPFNKIIQVAGKPDCGKSTWGCELVVAAQKSGAQVVYWDSAD